MHWGSARIRASTCGKELLDTRLTRWCDWRGDGGEREVDEVEGKMASGLSSLPSRPLPSGDSTPRWFAQRMSHRRRL